MDFPLNLNTKINSSQHLLSVFMAESEEQPCQERNKYYREN